MQEFKHNGEFMNVSADKIKNKSAKEYKYTHIHRVL